jgi:hypothetical protein
MRPTNLPDRVRCGRGQHQLEALLNDVLAELHYLGALQGTGGVVVQHGIDHPTVRSVATPGRVLIRSTSTLTAFGSAGTGIPGTGTAVVLRVNAAGAVVDGETITIRNISATPGGTNKRGFAERIDGRWYAVLEC